ncbi:hypothetical protein V8E51_018407 [Hyaloscypha variabilis]
MPPPLGASSCAFDVENNKGDVLLSIYACTALPPLLLLRLRAPQKQANNTWNKSVSAIGLSGMVWNNEGQGQNQPNRAEQRKGKRAGGGERRTTSRSTDTLM